MNIVLVSVDKRIKTAFLPLLDLIVSSEKLSRLELYSYMPYTFKTLKNLPQKNHYYFFLDLRFCKNPEDHIRALSSAFPTSRISILGSDDARCLRLFNRFPCLHGYLNFNWLSWKTELAALLHSLSYQIPDTKEAVIISGKREDIIIPYQSIYYIETIKGSHYCQVIGADDFPIFRGSIHQLILKLDERFSIVRSSTIANLSMVSRINRKEKLLFFDEQIFCTYTQRHYRYIQRWMKEKTNLSQSLLSLL